MNIKLFVPLGTQKFPFGRLIMALNDLVDNGVYAPDEIVMQSAMYPVEPKFNHVGLIPVEEFNHYIQEAEVVITHSGVNSIISSMQLGKPLVVVPRLYEYGEHVDNHQVEIAELMSIKYDVLILMEMKNLKATIDAALTHEYKHWQSHKEELVNAVRGLIV